MAQLQAIIFDVDGTLAETERDGHRVAFNQAFRQAGLDWHWSAERYGSLLQVAGGKERIRYFIEQHQPSLPPVDDLDEFVATLHQAKTDRYTARLQSGNVALRPGIRRLIQQARSRNIRLAIATTSQLKNVSALLAATLPAADARGFEVIAAGDMVSRKKPAPDVYQLVLDKLALSPQQCLAIEDTAQGLAAATAAGLTTVITVNEYTRQQDFSRAALVLNHLGEPEVPCQVLQGELDRRYFDVDAAERLLSRSV